MVSGDGVIARVETGRVSIVTGTIWRCDATFCDLTFDNRTEEALGVTANHPLLN